MSDKKKLKQDYTERLRKYERELSLKLRANGKAEGTTAGKK
jgi:hypothetical protein